MQMSDVCLLNMQFAYAEFLHDYHPVLHWPLLRRKLLAKL